MEVIQSLKEEKERGQGASRKRVLEVSGDLRGGDLCVIRQRNLTNKKKKEAWEERSTIETGRAPVQEATGKTSRRDTKRGKKWYYSQKYLKERPDQSVSISEDFVSVFGSREECLDWKELRLDQLGPAGFDGKGFHQFLHLFEMAAENEGAGDYKKVKQIMFFCKGRDLKEEIMEIDGWKELDWAKLVKEMKARWGSYRPVPRYTIQKLWTTVDG
ncbi:hypothetical protein BY996DRAFT_6522296 [Phakopsora pachyrhizi]|nr:hypothetical protein BY996DRAFT_6522296 [Phakopsora pachyrhizi]